MLSPFMTVDHRIDSALPFEERRVLRRSQPERLRFDPPAPGILLQAVVPEPRPLKAPSRLRVRLGEVLMALGRRLARPDLAT